MERWGPSPGPGVKPRLIGREWVIGTFKFRKLMVRQVEMARMSLGTEFPSLAARWCSPEPDWMSPAFWEGPGCSSRHLAGNRTGSLQEGCLVENPGVVSCVLPLRAGGDVPCCVLSHTTAPRAPSTAAEGEGSIFWRRLGKWMIYHRFIYPARGTSERSRAMTPTSERGKTGLRGNREAICMSPRALRTLGGRTSSLQKS